MMDRRTVLGLGAAVGAGGLALLAGAKPAGAISQNDWTELVRMTVHNGTYAFGSLGTALELVIQNPGDVTLTQNVDDAITDIQSWIGTDLANVLRNVQHT